MGSSALFSGAEEFACLLFFFVGPEAALILKAFDDSGLARFGGFFVLDDEDNLTEEDVRPEADDLTWDIEDNVVLMGGPGIITYTSRFLFPRRVVESFVDCCEASVGFSFELEEICEEICAETDDVGGISECRPSTVLNGDEDFIVRGSDFIVEELAKD